MVRDSLDTVASFCLTRCADTVDIVWTDVRGRGYRAGAGSIGSCLRAGKRGSAAVATVAITAAAAACGSLRSADSLSADTLAGDHGAEHAGRLVGISALAAVAADGIATRAAVAAGAEITSLDRRNRTIRGGVGIEHHAGYDRIATRSTGRAIRDAASSADATVGIPFVHIAAERIAALAEIRPGRYHRSRHRRNRCRQFRPRQYCHCEPCPKGRHRRCCRIQMRRHRSRYRRRCFRRHFRPSRSRRNQFHQCRRSRPGQDRRCRCPRRPSRRPRGRRWPGRPCPPVPPCASPPSPPSPANRGIATQTGHGDVALRVGRFDFCQIRVAAVATFATIAGASGAARATSCGSAVDIAAGCGSAGAGAACSGAAIGVATVASAAIAGATLIAAAFGMREGRAADRAGARCAAADRASTNGVAGGISTGSIAAKATASDTSACHRLRYRRYHCHQ